jgi:hypothetical protein
VIRTRFEGARLEADDLPDGPSRGVPILYKDVACTVAGEPTVFGLGPLREMAWPATSQHRSPGSGPSGLLAGNSRQVRDLGRVTDACGGADDVGRATLACSDISSASSLIADLIGIIFPADQPAADLHGARPPRLIPVAALDLYLQFYTSKIFPEMLC